MATLGTISSSLRVTITFGPLKMRHQGATQKHIDDLKAAADTQNRYPGFQRGLK
jgi:hypothetical protein